MYNRLSARQQENAKARAYVPGVQGKYDWRLLSRRRVANTLASPGTANYNNSSSSAPDDLPAGLFLTGSHGSLSWRSTSGSPERGEALLEPGRALAQTPVSSLSSHGGAVAATFISTPIDGGFRLARATSVDSIFDESQERCIHTAYRVSFQGDKRVKERSYRVTINGISFVLVERVISGHSDGVYQKSKKMWEHVPRGQVRVFASVPSSSSLPSSPSFLIAAAAHTSTTNCNANNNGSSSANGGSARQQQHHQRVRSVSSNASFGGSFTLTHTLVASLNGLRKFGHWGDASASIYNAAKEMPVTAVATDKADGEGCHVAAFVFEGERYWVVGLRDRHLLVRLRVPDEDIEAYGVELLINPQAASTAAAAGASIIANDSGTESVSTPPPFGGGGGGTGGGGTPPTTTTTATGLSAAARLFTRASMTVARAWRRLLRSGLGELEVEALHQELVEKQWTLCMDAIVAGCEHFIDYDASSDNEHESEEEEEVEEEEVSQRLREQRRTGKRKGRPRANPTTSSPTASSEGEGADGGGSTDEEDDEVSDVPLFFYAIALNEPSENGLSLPVDEAMRFFRKYRLPTVAVSVPLEVNSPEYDAERARISARLNSAGAVFYGVNDQGLVVRLWKCRCHAYELERAAQEFIVTHRLHGGLFQAKFQKKLSGLAKEARVCSLRWEQARLPFLVAFSEWLHSTRQLTPSTDLASLQELRGHWVSAQRAFRHCVESGGGTDSSASDTEKGVALLGERDAGEVDGADAETAEAAEAEEEAALMPEAILLLGPQGCGKSTIARALFGFLEQAGCRPRWINQDEVGNRRAYLSAIARASNEGRYTHILLDRMNLDETSRNDYKELNLKTVLVIAWSHSQGTNALVDVCFDRVKRRGASHRTFKVSLDLEGREGDSINGGGSGGEGNSPWPAMAASPPLSLNATTIVTALPTPSRASPPPVNSGGGNDTAVDVQLRRMRGILQDCAERYEVPDADPSLLELDVTLNCNAALQRVWARLQDRSVYDLPDFGELDAEEVFDVVFGYEELLQSYPQRITAVVLQANAPVELRALVPAGTLESSGKKVLDNVHVVLHNFSENPNPVALVQYGKAIGKLAMVELRAVVADNKATLLHVSGVYAEGHAAPAGTAIATMSSAQAQGKQAAPKEIPQYEASSNGINDDKETDSEASTSSVGEPVFMAVLSKSKKASYRYCAELLERAVLDPEPDPYITVTPLPRGTVAPFTYHFVANN